MTSTVEQLITKLAYILGVIALIAPITFIWLQARRPKGRLSGRGESLRTWSGVFLITLVLVGTGIVLWKPVPLSISDRQKFLATILGACFYFPAVFLYLWGLVTLGSQFGVSGLLGAELYQEHVLITNGPFTIIRHPMYLGVLCAALGALLIFRTWAMVLFTPMALVVIARAKREEALLAAEFGEMWQVYASKVPKWIPKRRVG